MTSKTSKIPKTADPAANGPEVKLIRKLLPWHKRRLCMEDVRIRRVEFEFRRKVVAS
jgi:hypothetical protein